MLEEALLLTGDSLPSDDEKAKNLLEFFGIPFQRRSTKDFRLLGNNPLRSNVNYRLVCAAQTFASVIAELQNASSGATEFARQIHSVFLYSNGDIAGAARVVSQLCGGTISVTSGSVNETEWWIADDPAGMCGAMRGLRVHPAAATLNSGDYFVANENIPCALISGANKVALLKATWNDVPVFVSSATIDRHSCRTHNSQLRCQGSLLLCGALCLLYQMGIRSQLVECPEASACLVIDDPLLRTRYGFLRFSELLAVMKQVRFSTSIAFIPWNWRRSDPKVVETLQG